MFQSVKAYVLRRMPSTREIMGFISLLHEKQYYCVVLCKYLYINGLCKSMCYLLRYLLRYQLRDVIDH